MPSQPVIDILLSAYNGAAFFCAQMDSLLKQTYPHWRLIIHETGSTDDTRELAESYVVQYPERIWLLPEDAGVPHEYATSDYLMLCGQDDHWHANKIERQLEAMQALEETHGRDTPLLTFCDAQVVDERLGVIHPSLVAFKGIVAESLTLPALLTGNVPPAGTVLFNRALLKKALPVPVCALTRWLLLTACLFGHVSFLSEALLDWRVHSAKEENAGVPGEELRARFGPEFSLYQRRVVEEYIALPRRGRVGKIAARLRYGLTGG